VLMMINGEFLLYDGKPLKVCLCSYTLEGAVLGRGCTLVSAEWCVDVTRTWKFT
jgi:hypothetical protein